MLTRLKQIVIIRLIKIVQKYGSHKVCILGRMYEVSREVFNPKYYFTSEFMARHIKVDPEDTVLDMGTGSGIQAITAGLTAPKVIAVDINPEAVRYARGNVKANELEDIVSVIEGDLFSSLSPGQKFSVILFTPPYLEGTPKTHFDKALFDPNKELAGRFFKEAAKHLKSGGYVQMLYSSIAGPEQVLSMAGQLGWSHSIMASEKTLTEEFIIYRLTLN